MPCKTDVNTLVIGANVAGSSFALWLSRLNEAVSSTCLILEKRSPEQCGRKACGSGLTSFGQRVLEWDGPEQRQNNIRFCFSDEEPVLLSLPPVVFTTRTAILDHLNQLRKEANDRSTTLYRVKIEHIDFDKRIVTVRDREDSRKITYTHLIIASGALSLPIRSLDDYLDRKARVAMTAFQFRFRWDKEICPTLVFDKSRYGSGYAWAWKQIESGTLDIGIGYPGGHVLPGAGAARARADQLTRSFASELDISIPTEAQGEFCPIPTSWTGYHPLPGVYTVGDAAGSAFYPTGEGLPQAALTGRIAALHLLGYRKEAYQLFTSFILRKKMLSGFSHLIQISPFCNQLIKSAIMNSKDDTRLRALKKMCIGET
jgi:flavin-dependent dehydrogenase